NSASMRFVTEFVAAFAYALHRLAGSLDAVEADVARMREVLEAGKDPVTAEPLYVRLAMHGHPDAHEAVRVLARDARVKGKPLAELLAQSNELAPYLAKMTPSQRGDLDDPANYRGASSQITCETCTEWEKWLDLRP